MRPELVMAASSVCLMLLATLLVYIDNRLLPGQMTAHHAEKGFPGIANGALPGNIVLLSAVLYIVGSYWGQWSRESREIALFIGTALSLCAFLFVYRRGLHDDAWAGAGEIHPAGVVAVIYTAGVIAALILFYAFSSVESADVWTVGVLLILYLPLANHVVLNFINERRHFAWCPRIFEEETRPMDTFVNGAVFVTVMTAMKLTFPSAWF